MRSSSTATTFGFILPQLLLLLAAFLISAAAAADANYTLEDGDSVYGVPLGPSGMKRECTMFSYLWSKSGLFANETMRAKVKEFCANSTDEMGWCPIGSTRHQTYVKFSSVEDAGLWIAGEMTDKQSDKCPPAPEQNTTTDEKPADDRKKRSPGGFGPYWAEEWHANWSPSAEPDPPVRDYY